MTTTTRDWSRQSKRTGEAVQIYRLLMFYYAIVGFVFNTSKLLLIILFHLISLVCVCVFLSGPSLSFCLFRVLNRGVTTTCHLQLPAATDRPTYLSLLVLHLTRLVATTHYLYLHRMDL